MWRNFLLNASYIFTINFNGTYKLGKNVHLVAKYYKILVTTKMTASIFLGTMILNSYTVNSYSSSSQNNLRLIYEFE